MTSRLTKSFKAEDYPAGLMSDTAVSLPHDEFGPRLETEALGLGCSTDVCVIGNIVFALAGGGLSIFRDKASGPLEMMGRLEGLAPTRQLAIDGTIAVVTMREGGMAVIDLSDLGNPTLVAWYDTVEFATGVALSAGWAFVTNRHYGIEIIDLTEPRHPRPLGCLRAGEAQSVAVAGDIACIGAWRDRQLIVADISDPRHPEVIAIAELDGYGDGIAMSGHHCYVATGHHARGIDGFPYEGRAAVSWAMLERGYGRGHGVEVFDLSLPGKPRLVHGIKTPPAFNKSPDSWRVTLAGQYLLHADSVNGVFVLDTSLSEPKFVGQARIGMPARPAPASGPSLQERAEPIIGVAMGPSGTIYAAGAESDLYRIPTPLRPRLEEVPAPAPRRVAAASSRRDPRVLFQGHGLVHAVSADDDMIVAATGMDGLVSLDQSGAELFRQPFERGARDVARDGDILFVAAGHEGLVTLGIRPGTPARLGKLEFDEPVRFVSLVQAGLVLAVVGRRRVVLVDTARPNAPRLLLDARMKGNIYGRQIVDGMLAGRYTAALSQTGGFRWFDLARDGSLPVARPETDRRSCPITEGAVFLADRALVVRLGGYYLLAPSEETDPRETVSIRLTDGGDIAGVPTITGGLLMATNRVSGVVHVIDIADVEAPRTLARIRLDGQVGRPVAHAGKIYVPAGHAGLLALDLDQLVSSGKTLE